MSYLAAGSRVFFVAPRANEALACGIDMIRQAPIDPWRQRVHIVFLEDLLERLTHARLSERMAWHFRLFVEKYVPLAQ
jgi:hypothetical protein